MNQQTASRIGTTPMNQDHRDARCANASTRWSAVTKRDASAEGQFIFAVRTTGIFCRPGCPAKTPRRENVEFYDTPAHALQAGYRPCKRCNPAGSSFRQRQLEVVARACESIEAAETVPTLERLAADAGMSQYHFHRTFKSITGLTPGQYARGHRAARVRHELQTSPSVTRAIYETGYQSSGRFYASTDMAIGMTPSAYRDNGQGERIRFATAETSLGLLGVAATDKGICSIGFGDDPDALLTRVQEQFAKAEIDRADPAFQQAVAAVVRVVEQPAGSLELPLDLRGTAFQHRVWNALRKVPAGTRLTYTELAELIDAPSSARAVARACAANPVALAVPCHRVVRKNGDFAGYRWGRERKRELLDRESKG
jgi:AraC family transcriptional regulator of adaptative response/methylated-DNA-[protein]-cysteine methyltransferase